MRLPSSKQPAVSLIELIVAMTIFLSLITSGVIMVSQVSKAAKKVEMEEYLYTEGQAILERITREIQTSAIDYEEYYSRNVLGATEYGLNYGEYHKQFFNPGYNIPAGPNPDGSGALCVDGITEYIPGVTSCSPLISTFDFETGANPYTGSGPQPDAANAMCDGGGICSTDLGYHVTDELALISPDGTVKVIIAKENSSDANALSIGVLGGNDSDGDGITDAWMCYFPCTGPTGLLAASDLTNNDRTDGDFVPFSPDNINIESLQFFISPIEDPFKGYNEVTSGVFDSVQQQPRVTIVMKASYQLYDGNGDPVTPNPDSYIGQPPSILFQTTVGTGVNNEIPAYSFP
jgi:type II secretory pathway pseudopilin PulG